MAEQPKAKTSQETARKDDYEPVFLTVKQVCVKLGIKPTTFYRLKKRGEFIEPVEAYQKHHYLFDAEQVNQWMLARCKSQD